MSEDRPTISSSRLAAADVARHSFGTVRRGFDPGEVRSFLEAVARELSVWEQREAELRQVVADAEERARHPVIDEATLTAALGQQSAQVLRKAHEQADAILREGEERAAGMRHEAQEQIQAAEASAAQRIAEAELSVGALQQQIEAASATRVAEDQATREEMLAQAKAEGRALLDEAQYARKRVLADMAQRRRTLHSQIEQFRAARDELAAAVLNVRDEVDRVVADLSKADDRARAAAAEVRMRQSADALAPTDLEVADAEVAAVVADLEADAPAPGPAAEGATTPPQGTSAVPGDGEVAVVVDVAEADVAVTGADGEVNAEADPEADTHDVEALFARLRASAPEEREPTPVPPAPPPAPEEIGVTLGGGDETTAAGSADAPRDSAVGAPDDEPDGADDLDGPSGLSGEEAATVARRAALLDPVTAQLAKRLKRALQDDQNQLLNRIRAAANTWSDAAVPAEDEHRLRYAGAASPSLTDAWAAGAMFARSELDTAHEPEPGTSGGDPAAVERLASELAVTVVAALRRRLSGSDGHEGGDAADRVTAAYREWRGERIERLVGDFAVAAFSGGTLQGAGGGAGARWLLARHEGACADCDDNSLAGAVGPGEEFPTGHHHPPAHGGCRCVVVPTQG